MNIYLEKKREQFEALRASIEGLQTRAADENRDLTDEELRQASDMGEQAKKLASEIEGLQDVETRAAKVREVSAAASVERSDTSAVDRDPGHYRSVRDGGQFSFFRDLYQSRKGSDRDAERRLEEHNRALTTGGTGGGGIVPPKWLTAEYAELARQGRVLAGAVRHLDLGNDPRPIELPKQTVGTDGVVAAQAAEGNATPNTDAFDTDVDTLTPKAYSGAQDVTRQLLNSSSPAVDGLIFADLQGAYNEKVENLVGSAIRAVGTAASATKALFGTMTTAETNGSDLVINAALAVRSGRKLPGDVLAVSVDAFGALLKLKDGSGRPIMVSTGAGSAVNAAGVGNVAAAGIFEGLPVIVSDGMDDGTNVGNLAVIRSADVILAEGPFQTFEFQEVVGPEKIRLAMWAYAGVLVRYAPGSVSNITITAA